MPATTTIGGVPNVVNKSQNLIGSNQYTGRVDYLMSSHTTIYGRYTDQRATQFSTGVQPLESLINPYGSQNAVIHWTEVIKPTLVNDLMVGFTRPNWADGRDISHGNVAQSIGLTGVGKDPGGPEFDVGGYAMDTARSYIDIIIEDNYQLKDDLNYVRGRHSLKFGGEVNEHRMYFDQTDGDQGRIGFQGVFSAACPAGNAACATALGSAPTGGDPFADYLLGTQTEGLVTMFPKFDAYQRYFSFYGQDSWRATSRLTINAGLRYERWRPWMQPDNITAQWDQATGTLNYALQNPLDYLDKSKCYGACAPRNPGVPREGYKTGIRDFGPRLGLAYQVTPGTVLRAAAGTYYDGNSDTLQISQLTSSVPPFGSRADVITTPDVQLPTVFTSNLFPTSAAGAIPQPNSDPPASFRPITPYMPTASVYEWSASLQQALGSSWSAELDYLGSHTIHEHMFVDLNSAQLPVGQYAGLSLQQRRIFPQWGRIGSWIPIGWAKYDAMVFSLKNRSWHNLSLVTNFTWAKGFASSTPGYSDHGLPNFFGPPDRLAGLSSWTPERSLVLGYNYTLPFGRGKAFAAGENPVVDKFVSGWTFSGITSFSTGSPQPAFSTNDLTGVALPRAIPNQICNPNTGPNIHTRLQWFNTTCFVDAPFGTWPNAHIGSIIFPGINDWDISIAKDTSIRFPNEKAHVEFRCDMFNAFNHTQWGSVDNKLGDAQYGQVTDTRPARKVQFGLKAVF